MPALSFSDFALNEALAEKLPAATMPSTAPTLIMAPSSCWSLAGIGRNFRMLAPAFSRLKVHHFEALGNHDAGVLAVAVGRVREEVGFLTALRLRKVERVQLDRIPALECGTAVAHLVADDEHVDAGLTGAWRTVRDIEALQRLRPGAKIDTG